MSISETKNIRRGISADEPWPNHALQRTAPRVTARASCERSAAYGCGVGSSFHRLARAAPRSAVAERGVVRRLPSAHFQWLTFANEFLRASKASSTSMTPVSIATFAARSRRLYSARRLSSGGRQSSTNQPRRKSCNLLLSPSRAARLIPSAATATNSIGRPFHRVALSRPQRQVTSHTHTSRGGGFGSHMSQPTSPNHALQRTGSAVTAPAADHRRLSTHRQVPRPLCLSLSLGSLGASTRS